MEHANTHRIDLLLQYALVRAAQEDDWQDRELGPIHLLKYVYLADLAFTERHKGETFTGASWQFHHFGPWQPIVHDRIEPALAAIGAERKNVRSARYDDDLVRFSVFGDVDHLRDALENELPGGVAHAVSQAVHHFGGNTAALLRHVYLTAPMVRAAPGELLSFAPTTTDSADTAEQNVSRSPSSKEKRQRKEMLTALKEKVRAGLAQRIAGARPAVSPAPRYDDVFVAGTEWLDVLAGEPVESVQGELTVGSDVWKSPARSDPDVP